MCPPLFPSPHPHPPLHPAKHKMKMILMQVAGQKEEIKIIKFNKQGCCRAYLCLSIFPCLNRVRVIAHLLKHADQLLLRFIF